MIVNATLNNQYHVLIDSIEYVIEYVKQNFNKFKSSLKKENKYKYLEKVNESLKQIFRVLFENENIFKNELECLILIKPYIIYIIAKNCENENFGFIECCIYLLSIFKSLINSKFINSNEPNKYDKLLIEYPKKIDQFRIYFNENIFIDTHKLDEMIEEFDMILRGE